MCFPLGRSPQHPDLFLKNFQGGNEYSVENSRPRGPVLFFVRSELPPESRQLPVIPPDRNAVQFRKGSHFFESLVNQLNIIRMNPYGLPYGSVSGIKLPNRKGYFCSMKFSIC